MFVVAVVFDGIVLGEDFFRAVRSGDETLWSFQRNDIAWRYRSG